MSQCARFVVGLTGGIGSGKSAAAECFARRHVTVVDTDEIAHSLTRPDGAAMPTIIATFGKQFVTPEGALDRAAMRDRVFADATARRQLEHILHPMIRAESELQCQEAGSDYVILAVPLLIESGSYSDRCQRICVVDCAPETQIARVRIRSNLNEAQIRAIMTAQASRAERIAAADDVIDNNGDLAALDRQVGQLDRLYRELAHEAR